MIDELLPSLDETLKTILGKSAALQEVSVSFAAPDDQFPPSGVSLPAVDFFLYDVHENRALREGAPRMAREKGNGATVSLRRLPPVYIDCSYLITAWSGESGEGGVRTEHGLLSTVMRLLLRTPRLPAGQLQGALGGQTPLPRGRVLQSSHLQSLGEFWQAMGGKPKAALHYTVTLTVDVAEEETARVVTGEPVITVAQKDSG